MFAKYAIVAMMAATVPLAGATAADAASRNGKKYEMTWVKSDYRYKGSHTSSPDYKTSRFAHSIRSRKKSRYDDRHYGWKKSFRHGHSSKRFNYHRNRSCSAAARRRFGYGIRIWGIGGKAYGRNACDRAMYECRRKLGKRKSRGRNPFARCVISNRT